VRPGDPCQKHLLQARLLTLKDAARGIPVRSPSRAFCGAGAFADKIPHIEEDLRAASSERDLCRLEGQLRDLERQAKNLPVRFAIPTVPPTIRALDLSIWNGIIYVVYADINGCYKIVGLNPLLGQEYKRNTPILYSSDYHYATRILAGPDSSVLLAYYPVGSGTYTLDQHSLSLAFLQTYTSYAWGNSIYVVYAADNYIYGGYNGHWTPPRRYSGTYPYSLIAQGSGAQICALDVSNTQLFGIDDYIKIIYVFDITTLALTASLAISGSASITSITYGDGELYMFRPETFSISVYSTAGVFQRELSSLPLAGDTFGSANIKYYDGFIFCADCNSDMVYKFDATTGATAASRKLR
jgi:hypothetical protein